MQKKEDRTFSVLKILAESQNFVSGESIGEILGISRAGILRHIEKLRQMGFNIVSESRNGHCLIGGGVYSEYSVRLKMKNDLPVVFSEQTVSTNDVARLHELKSGVAIAARQTSGRGRKSREFFSETGGVYMSCWFSPEYFGKDVILTPLEALKSVLFAGIAVCRALDGYGIRSELKWPNDVLIGGKKVSGILSEMVASAESIERLIIGIGINVYNNPGLDTAVSLSERGLKADRSEVVAKVSDALCDVFKEYFENGFSELREEYLKRSCTIGKEVTIDDGKEVFDAFAIDLNDDGFLIVERNNKRQVLLAGDVSIKKK